MKVSDDSMDRPTWHQSEVFCIHNGFMLGVFTQLMAFRFAQVRFDDLRARVVEFLDEVGLDLSIAPDHETFVGSSADRFDRLRSATHEVSKLLSAYYYVGSSAAAVASGFITDQSGREQVTDAVSHILDISPIEDNPLPRFLETVEAGEESSGEDRAVNAVLAPCLELVAELIRQLPDEACRHTCFVAMPFENPYLAYYPTLFTTLAHELKCVPLRAWGGLSTEIYIGLLYQLIRRADTVIADVSGANTNVVYEVGLAHGMGKEVHMLRRSDRPGQISNLMGIHVTEYSPEGENWHEREVSRYLAARAIIQGASALRAGDAPRDPEKSFRWRREHGGLRSPSPRPGDPPFVTIYPSFGDE